MFYKLQRHDSFLLSGTKGRIVPKGNFCKDVLSIEIFQVFMQFFWQKYFWTKLKTDIAVRFDQFLNFLKLEIWEEGRFQHWGNTFNRSVNECIGKTSIKYDVKTPWCNHHASAHCFLFRFMACTLCGPPVLIEFHWMHIKLGRCAWITSRLELCGRDARPWRFRNQRWHQSHSPRH